MLMNFPLPVVLILCLSSWISHGANFYLNITAKKDGLILANCSKKNDTCLRRGEESLECMCEDSYRDAETLRIECGDNGLNETAVDILEDENKLALGDGVCARAFAKLGYTVERVYNSSTIAANDSDSSQEIVTYTEAELEAKLSELERYSQDFWSLLDRTLVGVYLSNNQQRIICKNAYNEWLCSTSLTLYTGEGGGEEEEIRPCLDVCTRVVQECPYYLPSKFQEQTDNEIIYGGYPVFDCPAEKILIWYKREVCTDDTHCSIPYSLGDNCIRRSGISLTISSSITLLLITSTLNWIL